jgi:hypothetical protein
LSTPGVNIGWNPNKYNAHSDASGFGGVGELWRILAWQRVRYCHQAGRNLVWEKPYLPSVWILIMKAPYKSFIGERRHYIGDRVWLALGLLVISQVIVS